MTRIKTLNMNQIDMILALAEGNIGAVTAIAELVKASPVVDPQNGLGSYAPLFALDNLGIYGPNIWVLYKDVCGQSALNMLALLRGNQLGLVSNEEVKAASQDRPQASNLNIPAILLKVKSQLVEFDRGVA